MTDPWPFRSSLELGAFPTAVPCACLHARHVLREWGLNGLAESAELLVSELVTNAVHATVGRDGQAISLHLSGDATRILVEVWDADPRRPAPREPGEGGPPDHGLCLIAALSTRWDWYPTQDPPGKVVWCELAADPPAPSAAPPRETLPRRIPHARPKPQAEIVTDLDILRRLRDHLLS